MTDAVPPELPDSVSVAQPHKRQWWLAVLFAAIYAAYRASLASPLAEPGFRVGVGAGAMAMALILAWLVSRFWQRSYAPVVVVGLVFGFGLANGNRTQQKVADATDHYIRNLERRLEAWRGQKDRWLEDIVAGASLLLEREAIDRCLDEAVLLRDDTKLLEEDLSTGRLLQDRLEELKLAPSDIHDAWGHVQSDNDFATLLRYLSLVHRTVDAQVPYLSALRELHGRWRVDSDDTCVLDDDVEPAVVRRLAEHSVTLGGLLTQLDSFHEGK